MLVITAAIGWRWRKRAVRLVCLGHQHVALAQPRVGAERLGLSPDDHGGVQPGLGEDRGDHRGGAGLAVGSGHRDAILDPHQLAQHLRTGDDRDAPPAGGLQLRVVGSHRARDHHHVGGRDVSRRVADEDLPAQGRQPPGRLALLEIRARHAIAEAEQHLGDPGHAHPADADEVDGDVAFTKHGRPLPEP